MAKSLIRQIGEAVDQTFEAPGYKVSGLPTTP